MPAVDDEPEEGQEADQDEHHERGDGTAFVSGAPSDGALGGDAVIARTLPDRAVGSSGAVADAWTTVEPGTPGKARSDRRTWHAHADGDRTRRRTK